MNQNAANLARNFSSHFKSNSKNIGYGEIALFRQLSKSLLAVSNTLQVEEYHGSKSHVCYIGDGKTVRKSARCELSDLMIITYSLIQGTVRVSYIQAKSERTIVKNPCLKIYKGSTEQWFLLSRRPLIKGSGKFQPPSDLLQSALLPSIGSFMFFYRDSQNECELFYSSADNLITNSVKKYNLCRLSASKLCKTRITKGYEEATAACTVFHFAYYLFDNKIGSPIISNKSPVVNPTTIGWITASLRELINSDNKENTPLVSELLVLLGDNQESNGSILGAKNILIIKIA